MADDWLYSGALIAQVHPAVSTPVTVFVASMRTEITRIIVTNISSAGRTFQIFHDDDNAGNITSHCLWWDYPVASSSVYPWGADCVGAGISVKPGGVILARSDLTSGLVFSFYGIAQSRGR